MIAPAYSAGEFGVSFIVMNSRRYEMRVRAASAAATTDRILCAARARFGSELYDDVTLDDVAADAVVSVQTVLRRFGSKEGLVQAVRAAVQPEIFAQRDEAASGDVPAAVANLVEHYERYGDEVLHLLHQEHRVQAFAEITSTGRTFHLRWAKRVFAPWLAQRSGADRARLQAQLVAVCDVYTWFLLRRQAGLSKKATLRAITELVEGVLP
jgi:AcrR family transcriptional regulator